MRETSWPREYCPRCNAALGLLQEYCLECGERLPGDRGLVDTLALRWQQRFAWYPGDWIWPAFLLLAVALVATVAAVANAKTSNNGPTLIRTAPVTVGPGTVTGGTTRSTPSTVPVQPPPTLTTGPLPTAPGVTTAPVPPTTTAAPPPSSGGGLTSWPAGMSGYTDVLESIPASASGQQAALARARGARRAGLAQAGVLLSSDYSSLHPGYYVVFSGVYRSASEAVSALAGTHAKGFPGAYDARVSR
ncbi:MAG: hypothetical protein ACYDBR_04030 [Gaiellaceae bacterium]